ncbi:MAG: phosphotransferase family protein [Rhodocyclaceae bacterium]|jgi:aminoglycoside phosphotransferase (APT) family kinase protein|nr:phosphotransferase family protein [Rhodocyclaceae bacterium]
MTRLNPESPQAGSNLQDDSRLRLRLAAYLQTQTGRAWTLGPFTRYAVGFSWITFGFTACEEGAEEHGLILRLGPPYGLFAPYSAQPQFAALKVLEGSAVPAPRAYWWSDDAAILGAPFFVSERVAGTAPVPWGTGEGSGFEDGYRRRIGAQFVSALAALHRQEWHGQGFDDTVTAGNAAKIQLDFWEQARERWALRPYPMLHRALRWLRRNLPQAPRVSLVHGDYRLGNFLEQDGRITAILDWELVHPGDPHEDLGWAFLPQYAMGSGLICRLVSRDEFIAQYQRESGIAVNEQSLHFYRVFALVKLALTHIAAVRCFEDGRFNDMRMPAMGTQIAPVLRQIEKMLP